ncbi:uncharacterized protein LOC143462547 [Clavelina lepadiformis]|uniref:uncharacterized protein LOC143462547 n=1 Tax=Clavelina lepadiformis TaxID=159417 RepID=UPI0040430175
MYRHVILCLLLCGISPTRAQILSPDAVIRIFNVTYTLGNMTFTSATVEEVLPDLSTALANPLGPDFTTTIMDPCSTSLHLCHVDATCIDVDETMGIFQCKCNVGFNQTASIATFDGNRSLIPDGTFCPDLDECASGNHDCDEQSTCFNTRGSYTCTCEIGFTGTGVECKDVDECEEEICDRNAKCFNYGGSFSCDCNSGFTGDGFKCEDIDECLFITSCPTNSSCTNAIGSYVCDCDVGFYWDGLDCQNMDECATPLHACHSNARCVDNFGSYFCECLFGYHGDGVTCSDVDECWTPGLNNCHENATCRNTIGGFFCQCLPGFNGDGVTCDAIKEGLVLSCPDIRLSMTSSYQLNAILLCDYVKWRVTSLSKWLSTLKTWRDCLFSGDVIDLDCVDLNVTCVNKIQESIHYDAFGCAVHVCPDGQYDVSGGEIWKKDLSRWAEVYLTWRSAMLEGGVCWSNEA